MLIMAVILQIVSLLLVFVYFWAILLFHGRAKKQSIVSHSSTEAEYRAMATTAKEIIWLRWLLEDMGVSLSHPTPMYCDNKVLFRLIITLFFMSERSTSRLTVILFVTTSSRAPLLCLLFLLLCRLQISLLSRTPYHGFVFWLANSRCL